MPIKILMPALSPTMTEGNLARWLKKEGDKVKPGEVIAEIETDKATMELEAVDAGVLAKILVQAGSENVPINSLIAVVLEDGESEEDLKNMDLSSTSVSPAPQAAAVEAPKEVCEVKELAPSKQEAQTRIFASPLARRIAQQSNINLVNISGSGPHGRIVKADVLAFKPGQKTLARNTEEFRIIPHSNVRKIIAKRLLESKQTIPHFYLSVECRLDRLMELRAQMNEIGEGSYKLSVNDFVIKAASFAMQDQPMVNASWGDNGMVMYNNIDISVAVSSDTGLVTPVIKNSDHKSIVELSTEMKSLAVRARENKLRPEEFQGGGFTISNLGMFGIKNFGAIINPPQSSILAVGEGSQRVVVDAGQMKIATVMDVTLSCDHRVVDGAVGAAFLSAFKKYIENPVRMIIKENA